jgi:hypothetical protein
MDAVSRLFLALKCDTERKELTWNAWKIHSGGFNPVLNIWLSTNFQNYIYLSQSDAFPMGSDNSINLSFPFVVSAISSVSHYKFSTGDDVKHSLTFWNDNFYLGSDSFSWFSTWQIDGFRRSRRELTNTSHPLIWNIVCYQSSWLSTS